MNDLTPKKNKLGGFLFTIIGTLAVVGILFLLLTVVSLISATLIDSKYNFPAFANLTFFRNWFIISFFILEAILFIIYSLITSNKDSKNRTVFSDDSKKLDKIKKIAVLALSLILILVSVICIFDQTVITENGIEDKNLFSKKEIQWGEVRGYSVSLDYNGSVSFAVTLKNGKEIELFGQTTVETTKFKEQYTDVYDFALVIDEKLKEQGANKKIKDSDVKEFTRLFGPDSPDYNEDVWKSIQALIEIEPTDN